jgi:CubicO group peptidase (beta-lactamase class C family)
MRNRILAVLAALLVSGPAAAETCRDLPRGSAVALGWDPTRLQAARDVAKAGGSDAFMVITDGRVVLADGAISTPMTVASIRKSLISALYGRLIDAGKIRLDDRVGALGVSDDAVLTDAERGATVRDLLTATSGVFVPTAAETEVMKAKRPKRGSHPTGTFWYYNNWDFNVLGDIYQRASTRSVFTAFDEEIAKPLCMQDWDVYRDGVYDYDPAAPRFPAYRTALSARDLARFGLLYLNGGAWNGKQIVPKAWVAESTRGMWKTDFAGDLNERYGFLWWVTKDNPAHPALVGSFTAAGFYGQKMTILPAINTVILTRSFTPRPGGRPQWADDPKWHDLVVKTLEARRKP